MENQHGNAGKINRQGDMTGYIAAGDTVMLRKEGDGCVEWAGSTNTGRRTLAEV